ncbi:hypothetical protein C8J56DRAFT_1091458 [Mycena floridula]|nr:hypothetical protein C8J56DRAFT_1091458 [Mycena floridula]
MKSDHVFFKTYFEKRSFGHLLVNFNWIWVIHVAMFYFYVAFNSPKIYAVNWVSDSAMTWSATALGGAVASTVIMDLATLAVYPDHVGQHPPPHTTSPLPPHRPRTHVRSDILRRHSGNSNQLALILSIVQFYISIAATLLLSGMMFGDRVAGKSSKYLADPPLPLRRRQDVSSDPPRVPTALNGTDTEADTLPFHFLGFKSVTPEYTLHTHQSRFLRPLRSIVSLPQQPRLRLLRLRHMDSGT